MSSVSTDRLQGVNVGAAVKVPCRLATTANISLSGLQTIDGVAVVQDDRVLVKNQTISSENGIYLADSGAWQRDKDWDGSYDVKKGTIVHITEGSTYTRTWWEVTTSDPITVGTTGVTIIQGIADAANVTFLPSGIGAVARPVQSELRDRGFNVKGFGALGDGSTDDSTAFANAIIAARAANSFVYVPDTTVYYKLTAALIPASDTLAAVPMIGVNKSKCRIVRDGNGPTINISGVAGPVYSSFAYFENLSIENPNTGTSASAIQGNYASRVTLKNCLLPVGRDGIVGTNKVSWNLYGTDIYGPGISPYANVGISGHCLDWKIFGGRIYFFNYATSVNGDSIQFFGTNLESNRVVSSLANTTTALEFNACYIETFELLHTNAITIPLSATDATNWVDGGGNGYGSVGVAFNSCFINGTKNTTNLAVMKIAPGSGISLTLRDCYNNASGINNQIGGSFTPANATVVGSGLALQLKETYTQPTVYMTLDASSKYEKSSADSYDFSNLRLGGDAASLNRYAELTWTPAWTSSGVAPVLNNGTLTGTYTRVGRLVTANINLVPGNTTTFGTGTYRFSLPFTASGLRFCGAAHMTRQGVNDYSGIALIDLGGTYCYVIVPGGGTWTPTVPATLAATDLIDITISYWV